MSALTHRALLDSPYNRGDSLTDRINLRLFTARFSTLTPSFWNQSNVCSSYWRFYFHDREGAYILLPGEESSERYPLTAGRAYFIPAGVRFDCRCEASAVGQLYAHFDITGLPGLLLRDLFARPVCLPQSVELEGRTRDLLSRILPRDNQVVSDDLVQHCRWKSTLYDALALALEALPAADRERRFARANALEPVLPALEKIEHHLAERLSNAELAATCCWSEDHFIRRFKECVGEPPATYIQARRVEAAAQRLLFSTDSIEKIAAECGFGNRFYLSRVFAQHTGSAPATYRKLARI